MKKDQEIKRLLSLIPQRIRVQVIRNDDEEGVWAKILDLPNCYTQSSNINELPSMLTDLVLTHFEVPEEYREHLGQYMPMPKNHLKMEEMFRKLIEIGNKTDAGEKVSETFQRVEAIPV